MTYLVQRDLEAAIPAQQLVDALDDDGDGAADANKLADVIAGASRQVDGFLAGRYTVPFSDPAPAAVREAAFVFACELIYARRPSAGENPFKKRADDWRKQLELIASGKQALDAVTPSSFGWGASVTDAAAIDDTTR